MRNAIKTTVVAAVTAVFVASVAIAGGGQDQGRRGPGGPGFGAGFGGPGEPGGPGGRGMSVIMRELTDEQRTQVRAIMQEVRQDGPPVDMNLRRQLEAELLADAPNDAKIEELRQQILAAQSEGLSRYIVIQKKVAQVLTAEQRAKARERLAEAPEGRGRGERRGRK